MHHIDLYSGIGGFSYAVDQVFTAHHTFVEIDEFCTEVCRKHWPDGVFYKDVKEFKPEKCDLLTAGTPCQPVSYAGNGKGKQDKRWLWDETIRCVRESEPRWFILENPLGILNHEFETICLQLEEGYEIQPYIIPASAVGAPHKRERVWIVGYSHNDGLSTSEVGESTTAGIGGNKKRENKSSKLKRSNSLRKGVENWERHWKEIESELCRVDDGFPTKLDKDRIKALGNAIVPQVAIELLTAIK